MTVRVASLLPSATEIIAALGCGDVLRAVSHECDYPPEVVAGLPRLSVARLDGTALESLAVDDAVRTARARGESLYAVDATVLAEVRPDLVVTQSLCTVCAVDGDVTRAATRAAGLDARVLELEPVRLREVFDTVEELGAALDAGRAAAALRGRLEERLALLEARTSAVEPVPLVVLEWLDPPFEAGHWVPDVIAAAGGRELLGRAGRPSRATDWKAVVEARPAVVLVSPCGFDLERTVAEARRLDVARRVHEARVVCLDGNALLSRPAPRLVDAAELIGHVLHPDVVPAPPAEAGLHVVL